ncbi:MAG: Flp pilus assembly complex ATPase component TadA, partial [Firmicutes bacterium]|nr:Flp pilus assembly complex ATPase component TadA [Bacillota bacterium]
ITTDQLSIALAEQRHNHIPLGRLLVRLGFVTENAIRDIMARTIGQQSVDLAQVVADPEALKLVPQEFARRNRVLPIAFDGNDHVLTIATTEIFNVVAMDQLRAMLGPRIEIKTLLASEAQLEDYIDKFYGYELSVDGILKEIETGEIDYESLQATGGDEYTQPMVRLVNALLVDAVKRGASDIHFEPEYAFVRIRYRIDGVLETVRSLHKSYLPGITVRLKVVSNMNIAETRAPQDGRLSLTLNGRQVDFRVSTQPTVYGENIVLRVLDREKSIISLDRMNFPKEIVEKLNLMLARPEGILIVTGPTGSGKTTTLMAALRELNSPERNILTLEDPVEYQIPGINQVQINERAGLTFARGLRAFVRQDPDVIMVGEIRDGETAEIAVRSALTGHLVLSTLHTDDAIGAVTRLIDMGIEPFLLASTLLLSVAQRLVRVLCPKCKVPIDLPEGDPLRMSLKLESGPVTVYEAPGCSHCGGTGYRGRVALFEVFQVTPRIRQLITQRAPVQELAREAARSGMRTLQQDGCQKALQGVTSLAEVQRVTYSEELPA